MDVQDQPVSRRVHLGVDIGTSVSKAALFDDHGEIIALSARPVPLQHPAEGHVEQDPDTVLRSVADVLADVEQKAGGLTPDLVAITGQGDGCWLVDEDARPVRPGVSWMDGRGVDLLARWTREGVTDAVYRVNGNMLFPGAQAVILKWLDEHEPASVQRAATAAYCKDVVVQRLTGLRATDASDASLPFGDGVGEGYSADVLDMFGLKHRAGLLAPVVRPLPVAEVSDSGEAEAGLAAGTQIVSGPFDIVACAAGAGVTRPGDGLLVIGTTLACQVAADRLDIDGEPAGMNLATPAPNRWMRVMPAMVGCASLDWALKLVGMQHNEIDAAIETSLPGAGGVEVLPYFAPSGERAPFVNPAARGQYTGIQLTTTREDIVRATCEGLAYAARHCMAAAGLSGRLVVCGGGARSRPWLRIFASVLQRPVHVARGGEVGARGAVLGALQVTGRDPDVARWTDPEVVVDPDPATVDLYEDGYRRYREQQESARRLWRPV